LRKRIFFLFILLFLQIACVSVLRSSDYKDNSKIDNIKREVELDNNIFKKDLNEKISSQNNFPKGEKLKGFVKNFLFSYGASPAKYRLAQIFIKTVENYWESHSYEPSKDDVKEIGLLKLMRCNKVIEFAKVFHQDLLDKKISNESRKKLTDMALAISLDLFLCIDKLCQSNDPYSMDSIFNNINSILIEGGALVIRESKDKEVNFSLYKIASPQSFQTVTLKNRLNIKHTVPLLIMNSTGSTAAQQGFSSRDFPSAIVELDKKVQLSLAIHRLIQVPTDPKALESFSLRLVLSKNSALCELHKEKLEALEKIEFETIKSVFKKDTKIDEILSQLVLSTAFHELVHGFHTAFGFNDRLEFDSQAEVSAHLGEFSVSRIVKINLLFLAEMAALGIFNGHESYSNEAARTMDLMYATAMRLQKLEGPPLSVMLNKKKRNDASFRIETVTEELISLLELTNEDLHMVAAETHLDVFKIYPPVYQKLDFHIPMPFDSFKID